VASEKVGEATAIEGLCWGCSVVGESFGSSSSSSSSFSCELARLSGLWRE